MTPEQQRIAQLEAELAATTEDLNEKKALLQAAPPPAPVTVTAPDPMADPVSDSSLAVLECVGKQATGVRAHEIEKHTKFSELKVRHHLAWLERRGYIATHGGDWESLRYKLAVRGREFLAEKELL